MVTLNSIKKTAKEETYTAIYLRLLVDRKVMKVSLDGCEPSIWQVISYTSQYGKIETINLVTYNHEIGYCDRTISIFEMFKLLKKLIQDGCTFEYFDNPYYKILE